VPHVPVLHVGFLTLFLTSADGCRIPLVFKKCGFSPCLSRPCSVRIDCALGETREHGAFPIFRRAMRPPLNTRGATN